jgi:hypothetical protein
MKFCIDTSSLLQAHRAYPAPHFPTLWTNLSQLISAQRLVSSEEVLRELEKKEGDVVHTWAKAHAQAFLPLVERVQTEVTAIMRDFPKLVDERKQKSFGDPFVIATAIAEGCTVVTEENEGTPERPFIPTVCARRNVSCMKLIDLIRAEGWVFR